MSTDREEFNSHDGAIEIVRGNITKQAVDAIVNSTNFFLSGTDLATEIHRVGGPDLKAHCRELIPLKIGEAKITPGYNLPAQWVIHTAGPIWVEGISGVKEEQILARCYRSCLAMCHSYPIETIAIPGITRGIRGFPRDRGCQIAIAEAERFLQTNNFLKKIVFVCPEEYEYKIYHDRLSRHINQIPASKQKELAVNAKAVEFKRIKANLTDKNLDNELKVTAIKTALRHGNDGIKLLFKILKTERGELQWLTYDLLWQQANNKGKKRLLEYFPWRSEVGANYLKLRTLLIEQKWQEADLETRRLMLAITGAARRQDRSITQKDIETFPCQDLLSIDRLWCRYSSGKFGFSVVKVLYDRTSQDYSKLASKVGWRLGDKWLKYKELTFTKKARQGHLPVAWLVPIDFSDYWMARFARIGWKLLFARLNCCNLSAKEDN